MVEREWESYTNEYVLSFYKMWNPWCYKPFDYSNTFLLTESVISWAAVVSNISRIFQREWNADRNASVNFTRMGQLEQTQMLRAVMCAPGQIRTREIRICSADLAILLFLLPRSVIYGIYSEGVKCPQYFLCWAPDMAFNRSTFFILL